ncbi:MAG TPA: hypothetical protein VK900_00035 [Anaerolineales bacterium]|nr:hypothetical protein [Anaerolineales bacterium]
MPPRPALDRALLIPIAVGVVSLLGIAWLFWRGDLSELFLPPTVLPTAIPLDVGFLETEVASLFPSATPTRDQTPAATGTPADSLPGVPAETLPATGTTMTKSPPPPSATPTPDRLQPLSAGRYDDTDPNIAYDRSWTALKNSSTAHSYQGTIHASYSIGNAASFRFTGEGFILGYQRGRSFGTVTVIVDGQSYSFHEQAFDLVWRSPQLDPGDHFVRIIHESGESVNLDYIEILD